MATRWKAPELLAYMAGVVDSDGWIGINKSLTNPQRRTSPRYQPQVVVVNTALHLLQLFQEEFGGSILTRKKVKEHHKTICYWKLGDWQAVPFCRAITPYLRVKQAQAELLVEWMETKQGPEVRGKGAKISEAEKARRETLYQRYKVLNDDRRHQQRLSGMASRTDEAIV